MVRETKFRNNKNVSPFPDVDVFVLTNFILYLLANQTDFLMPLFIY